MTQHPRRRKPPIVLTRRGEHALVLAACILIVLVMGIGGGIEVGTIPLP